jgi:hypothetical protein
MAVSENLIAASVPPASVSHAGVVGAEDASLLSNVQCVQTQIT